MTVQYLLRGRLLLCAKRKGLLRELRTAASGPVVCESRGTFLLALFPVHPHLSRVNPHDPGVQASVHAL
jgi:hypothetical protein